VDAVTLRETLAPWAGLFVGAAAWIAHHQFGSDRVYWSCTGGGPLLTGGLGLACFALAAAAGFISWNARPSPAPDTEGPTGRTFVSVMSAGCAAIFCFAILLQSLSGFIVPGCLR
jgi:hypothetical protein